MPISIFDHIRSMLSQFRPGIQQAFPQYSYRGVDNPLPIRLNHPNNEYYTRQRSLNLIPRLGDTTAGFQGNLFVNPAQQWQYQQQRPPRLI